ncbi:hypothetical protein FO519_006968 [Halicephalobus sp. NKZ332]|nr:hypothetical protein FO519_006968 [Halicephalobus sp. NKZ332]
MEKNVAYQEPYSPKSLTTTFPATRPVLGPTIIPTVQAPEHAGSVYPAEATFFRHIDSSSGTSTSAGPSGRARLAEAEDLEEGERVERGQAIAEEVAEGKSGRKKESQNNQGNDETTSPRRTQKKKINKWPIILGILLGLAILCLIGIFIAWAVTSDGFQHLGGFSDICSTKECIELAAGLTRSIDPSISICDNFYRYSCGQFHFEHPSNPENVIDYQSRLKEEVENKLNELISKAPNSTSFSMQFTRALYSQCTDFPLRESVGTEPLITLLRNLPCGPILPICNVFDENYFTWERNVGLIDFYAGSMNLIVFNREANPQNPTEIILSFHAPDFTNFLEVPRRSVEYLRPTSTSEFQALLSVQLKNRLANDTISYLLGVKWNNGVSRDMDEVVEFIVALDELSSISRQDNLVAQVMTLQEFSQVVQPINLKAVFDASLSASHTWSWSDTVAVHNIFYYQNLYSLIQRTSKKAIANYLTIVTAVNLRQFLHLRRDPEDWRTCIQQMSSLDPVANIYANSYPFDYGSLTSFFNDLRAFFITENLQFNPQTLDTLRRADMKVGVPTRILDDGGLSQMFSSIRIQEDSYEQRKTINMIPWRSTEDSDYFANLLAAKKLQRSSELNKIGSFVQNWDSVNWPSLESKFVYNSLGNEIIVPIGVLQSPPLAIPLSAAPISSVLATSGFIFYGFLYETAVSLQQENLDLPCARQVYDSFVQEDLSIRPDEFVTKSVLNLNTLKLVFQKLQDWKRIHSVRREQALPGFGNYSDEQMIMFQFGSLMCSTEGELLYSPYESMINTVVSLSPEFQFLFRCPAGSRMVTGISCELQRLASGILPPAPLIMNPPPPVLNPPPSPPPLPIMNPPPVLNPPPSPLPPPVLNPSPSPPPPIMDSSPSTPPFPFMSPSPSPAPSMMNPPPCPPPLITDPSPLPSSPVMDFPPPPSPSSQITILPPAPTFPITVSSPSPIPI